MKRTSLLMVVFLSAACNASAITAAPDANICKEAFSSVLRAEPKHVAKFGTIVEGRYKVTNLSRGDGHSAFVLTDIEAVVDFGSGPEHVQRDVGYFEDTEKCWPEESSGRFFCYETDRGRNPDPYGPLVLDRQTRAFLSVLTFFATGGKADTAAKAIAARETAYVDFDQLLEQTSAPSGVGSWYYCQACEMPVRIDLGHAVSLKGVRFGRRAGFTYFITSSGWVAQLSDANERATYVKCTSKR